MSRHARTQERTYCTTKWSIGQFIRKPGILGETCCNYSIKHISLLVCICIVRSPTLLTRSSLLLGRKKVNNPTLEYNTQSLVLDTNLLFDGRELEIIKQRKVEYIDCIKSLRSFTKYKVRRELIPTVANAKLSANHPSVCRHKMLIHGARLPAPDCFSCGR